MDQRTQRIPERVIPLPLSVSEQARAMLARGSAGQMPPWPPLDDKSAWLAVIDRMDSAAETILQSLRGTEAAGGAQATAQAERVGGVPVFTWTPGDVDPTDRRVVLYLHGGAWVQGGGVLCQAGAVQRAETFGAQLLSVDYRMPPNYPFPAAHDDAVEVYRELLQTRSAKDIIVGGDSAGANIAAGLVLRLRDEGLPLPAGLVLDTPATDLTASGDTYYTNEGVDTVLVGDFEATMALYAGDADRRHPHVSPLFADFEPGFVPTLLLTGTRDRLLSDTVRLHRVLLAAGVEVELHVFEAQGHGGFLGTAPEDLERAAEIRRFVSRHLRDSSDE